MPYVNIKVTREGVTTEQKATLIRETTAMLARRIRGRRRYTLFEIVNDDERFAHGKQYIYDGLESGALSPFIDRTFPLDAIADAHRYMESNKQKGKIVVTV